MELLILNEVDSTQEAAKALAREGKPDGFAVMALAQTAGRGRLGRSWVSQPGKNLTISVILRPTIAASEAPLLGFAAAVAAAETVEHFKVRDVRLKWPNDVLVGGRKIAGILPEAVIRGDALEFIVMGVGLNLNALSEDFPPDLRETATSVIMSGGFAVSPKIAAHALAERLEAICARICREGVGFIVPLWTSRWSHRGVRLEWNGTAGTAESLAADGALLLRRDDGSVTRISSGEPAPPERSCCA
jgi:BirA family transcriptional regulator, biotin operon repressor / biotin---[acetyl-CoA-carboxylase] ligase